MMRCRMGAHDRGAATIEIAILTPALLLLASFVIFAGRVADAHTEVAGAARDAARSVSIEGRGAPYVVDWSYDTYECVGGVKSHIDVDIRPAPAPGRVVATFSCEIKMTDLGVPLPGTRTVRATAVEVIDAYRSR
ncbi:MAG: TadE family protein [Acidimicrobiales bacterium]